MLPAAEAHTVKMTSFSGGLFAVGAVLMLSLSIPLRTVGQIATEQASNPTTANIVRQLVQRNAERAVRLDHYTYTSQRHYHLEYDGFPHPA